jgi:hypothetical protein
MWATEWQFIVTLVIAIPIVLFPAAFVWYLNIGSLYAAIKRRQTAREQDGKGTVEAMQHATVTVNKESVKI